MGNIQRHKEIIDGIHDMYVKKQSDYGDSFSKSIEKYGNISALVRMSDKWNRLENLVMNGSQIANYESLEDTCLDLANYLIMFVMELEKQKNDDEYLTDEEYEEYKKRTLDNFFKKHDDEMLAHAE